MAIRSVFANPAQSVGTGIAVAGIVLGVHATVTPNNGTIMATDAYDPNLEASRKEAALISFGVVSGISLLTKDVNVLVIGGLTMVALDWFTRYCIARHPATGQIVTQTPQTPTLQAVV
jgi:hypothetical protein